jgi:hypothetical protein
MERRDTTGIARPPAEGPMQQIPIEHLGDTRIQVVFRDREASFRLSGDATLDHIASTLSEISRRFFERPLAVYVTLKRPDC